MSSPKETAATPTPDHGAQPINVEKNRVPHPITEETPRVPEDSAVGSPTTSSPNRATPTLDNRHQCSHDGIAVSEPSRHDAPKSKDLIEDDTAPSDDPSTPDDDAGLVLDPENEGDAELLKKQASGTCDITDDLVLLRSRHTSDSSHAELGEGIEVGTDPHAEHPENSGLSKNKKTLSSEKTTTPDTTKTDKTKNVEDSERLPEHDANMIKDSDPEEDFHEAFDKCIPSPDVHTSDSYEPPNTSDEGGRAGLDPNHSEMWVPSVIYPEGNLSKSKKRRRRQKKREEFLKNQDSLGKLLRGEQTPEEAEKISTYDMGNCSNTLESSMNESGIIGGNLLQNKRKKISNCSNKKNFAATLNSTKFGGDFEDDHSDLREGSPEKDIEDDFNINADDEVHQKDTVDESIRSPVMDKSADNDSLSSNSNGAKRKRKRTKKPQAKPSADEDPRPAEPVGPKPEGRETRSRALVKQTIDPDVDAIKNKNEAKGEREKNPQGASEIAVFKVPAPATRSEVQRVVSKAVLKSKLRTSSNFAIQSKIQNFRIITEEKDVRKISEIDDFAPLIEIKIPEFIWPQEDKTQEGLVHIKTRGVIQFIVLSRNCHLSKETWDTPKLEHVRDFTSYLVCKIAELKLDFGHVLRWTNPWGDAVAMGLDSTDLDMLHKFRTFMSTLRYVHLHFNTFPKDGLANNFSLSILLRSDLREFKEQYLAEALFARNQLFGLLETLQSETYTAADTTRAGVSKSGWRNVTLEGDEVFMTSLSKFTALHWFHIGPASVQIHGGERRAETPEVEANNRRRRFNLPAGQMLTATAQKAINKSFRDEQSKLILAKRQANPSQSANPGAPKGAVSKIKKKK